MTRHRSSLTVGTLLALVAIAALVEGDQVGWPDGVSRRTAGTVAPGGCTVLLAADADATLAGNNEDGLNPLTRIWFVPGQGGGHGSAFVGYYDLRVQGGMNDAGLFFDGLAVREVTVPAKPGKPTYTGDLFVEKAMAECSSVACTLDLFAAASMPGTWNGQYLFGDRTGDSAIIEPQAVVRKTGAYQVATNFFQSEVPLAARSDARYVAASDILRRGERVSVDVVRAALDATHQEGTSETVYSTIYDLRAGTIRLYFFHDYEEEVTFNLQAELARGLHGYEIPALFTPRAAADGRIAAARASEARLFDALPKASPDAGELTLHAGTYKVSGASDLLVRSAGDRLYVRRSTTPWIELVPTAPSEFAYVSLDPSGTAHVSRLRFADDLLTGRHQVEIRINDAATVATREDGLGFGAPLCVAVAVFIGAVAIMVLRLTERRGH